MFEKKILPHIVAVLVCFAVMAYFFKPAVFDGKVLPQGDVQQATGMQTEVQYYWKKEGIPSWTNQAYVGMPTYLIYNPQDNNWVQNVAYNVMFVGGKYDVSDTHVLYFWIGLFAYFGLLFFGFSPPIAMAGAICYAMMTNNLVLLEAGHCNKVLAMGLAMPVLGSAWRLLKGDLVLGGAAFAAFLSLQVSASHVQMVYYTFFVLGAMGLAALVYAAKKQAIKSWLYSAGLMAAGVMLAVLSNLTSLWTTYEYSQESVRGRSELTQKETKEGMNKDDIFAWAHTKMETYTMIMPNFMGGSSSTIWAVEKGSETQKVFNRMAQEGVPQNFLQNLAYSTGKYWGGQAFTAGPIYFGVVLVFLALLGLLVMRSPLRWALGGVLFFFTLLSWGRDFSGFNNFMVDFFPFYNKFRDVKMTLAIGQSVAVVLAAYGLRFLWQMAPVAGAKRDDLAIKAATKQVYTAVAIMAGFCLLALAYSSMGDLTTNNPNYLLNLEDIRKQAPDAAVLMERLEAAMQIDRAGLIRADALKSLLFVLLAGGLAWAAVKQKLHPYIAAVVIFGAAVVDYGLVNRDYINEKSFETPKSKSKVLKPVETKADIAIKEDKDPHYRVLDFSRGNPASSALASYFHKSVGGHHAAKPMLYEEFTRTHGFPVNMIQEKPHLLAMLNVKYVIQNAETAMPFTMAMGNAWFVNEVKTVDNADAELAAIANFEPRQTAICQQRFGDYVKGLAAPTGANDKIYLTKYHPDHLTYQSEAATERFAVFSEMYYPPAKGWNTYIDGQKVENAFIKVNYLLRGLRVPAGTHTIEMRFEPKSVSTGKLVTLLTSLLILAGVGYAIYGIVKQKNA